MIKTVFIFVLALFLFSCKMNHENPIQKISVLYVPGIISTPYGNNCSYKFSYNLSIDTVINNKKVLNEIQSLISELNYHEDQEYNMDSRIYCKIQYSNGDISNLYLGELHGICLNGKIMHENKEFQMLIKENIGYFYYLENVKATSDFYKKRRKKYNLSRFQKTKSNN